MGYRKCSIWIPLFLSPPSNRAPPPEVNRKNRAPGALLEHLRYVWQQISLCPEKLWRHIQDVLLLFYIPLKYLCREKSLLLSFCFKTDCLTATSPKNFFPDCYDNKLAESCNNVTEIYYFGNCMNRNNASLQQPYNGSWSILDYADSLRTDDTLRQTAAQQYKSGKFLFFLCCILYRSHNCQLGRQNAAILWAKAIILDNSAAWGS